MTSQGDLNRIDITVRVTQAELKTLIQVFPEFGGVGWDRWNSTRVAILDGDLMLPHLDGNLVVQLETEALTCFAWQDLTKEAQELTALGYYVKNGGVRIAPSSRPESWPQLRAIAEIAYDKGWVVALSGGMGYQDTISFNGISTAENWGMTINESILCRRVRAQKLIVLIKSIDFAAKVDEGSAPDKAQYVIWYTPSSREKRLKLQENLLNEGYLLSSVTRDTAEHPQEWKRWVVPTVVDSSIIPLAIR